MAAPLGKTSTAIAKFLSCAVADPMVLAPEGRSSPRARQVPVDGAVVTPAEAVVVATPGPVVACVVAGCELAPCTVAGAGFWGVSPGFPLGENMLWVYWAPV